LSHGAATAVLAFAAVPALAAPSDKATGSAGANVIVVTRLSFIKIADLDFGRLIPGTTAGTVIVATDGTRTATGGVKLASGPSQPARFAGYGQYNNTVAISINAPTRTMTRAGGTETMTFDTFVIGSTPEAVLSTAPLSFRIGATNGQFNFPVGATLRVKANQTPGLYTGTFTLTLEYQ
jgi:hypothetical protein